MRCFAVLTCVAVMASCPPADDRFAGLTALADGALVGENVDLPVSGFEIRLLRHGEVLYHRAFGAWSLDRIANTDSSTKTLSGALVMSVLETSEPHDLDTRLAEVLPAFDVPLKRQITIRQAFSHTSGLGNSLGSPILSDAGITLQQAAEQIAQGPLTNGLPGTRFAYGGVSMHAAGAAIEVIAGTPFVQAFADRITGPLGMANTAFVIASPANPRVAGGAASTATEFGRFMDMLLNGGVDRVSGARILSADSVEAMLTRQTTDDQLINFSPVPNSSYGVGVWVDQFQEYGTTVDALAGGARGFHSWIDRSEGLVFTFSTDLSSFSNVESLSALMHIEILIAISELACPADWYRDGSVTVDDIFAFLSAWFAGNGDFNGDGQNTVDDIFAYLSAWFAGGC